MQYVGIDVSKLKLDCCWLRDPENNKIKTKVFKNTLADHDALAAWLRSQTKSKAPDIQIVMEATSIYHESLAYALHGLGFRVCVTNPARSKDFANSLGNTHKTDAKDSFMLAMFGKRMTPDLLKTEHIAARELQALLARMKT